MPRDSGSVSPSSSCDESDEDITASLRGFTLCFTGDDEDEASLAMAPVSEAMKLVASNKEEYDDIEFKQEELSFAEQCKNLLSSTTFERKVSQGAANAEGAHRCRRG